VYGGIPTVGKACPGAARTPQRRRALGNKGHHDMAYALLQEEDDVLRVLFSYDILRRKLKEICHVRPAPHQWHFRSHYF
jgi:hypothetical protein